MTAARLECRILRSAEELRAWSGPWDDLWRRSAVGWPTVRAESIAAWLEHRGRGRPLRALLVLRDGHPMAALPLVAARWKKLVKVGRLTGDAWVRNGELLLDESADTTATLACLCQGLQSAGWPLVQFDEVELHASRWLALRTALAEANLAVATRTDYLVGRVDVPRDWQELEAGWSRNHRHRVRRLLNKISRLGGVRLQRPCHLRPDEAGSLLDRALTLEDRGWKGKQGTSVLKTPGVAEFYRVQAELLASWDLLEMASLELHGEMIANSYGFRAGDKGFSAKVAYDEQNRELSPGHLLMYFLLRDYQEQGQIRTHDFFGPLADWTEKWATQRYEVGRIVIAADRWLGRAVVAGCRRYWPLAKRWQKIDQARVDRPHSPLDHDQPLVATTA